MTNFEVMNLAVFQNPEETKFRLDLDRTLGGGSLTSVGSFSYHANDIDRHSR